eukprot:gnl/MRDRNA2_/MRDRNA2_98197_c0_seq1.p1 gnl/MRDRNA2_/MRDRNA2_98197_c0~~gnl/MRDRNA2_/MRDRNA2_98197_c0_seq1.p1  ORF type:complete len:505 (+),score=100.25 gnl/MRDRNA2_/MRDRNA2_98197_c0_seq1:80-1594(+)
MALTIAYVLGALHIASAQDNGYTSTVAPPSKPLADKQEGILGDWIFVGELQVGCGKQTPIKVLFDTGSSLLVVKTGRTFDAVAKAACEKIGDMFINATGCQAGVCGKCYRHTECYQDLKKKEEIDYGSGPVLVHRGMESVAVAGQAVSGMVIGELVDFGVQTFTRKDFQGICGLMHNAGGEQDGKSLFQVLREKKNMERFGYCINDAGESRIYWFDKKQDHCKRVDIVCQHHWGVDFADFKVGDENVEASKAAVAPSKSTAVAPPTHFFSCEDKGCVAILDTGTNFIVGPAPLMTKAKQMIIDRGFRGDCRMNLTELPQLEFTLGNEVFSVSPEHYIAQEEEENPITKKKEPTCVLLIGEMEMGGDHGNAPMIILGTPFMRSNYIQFNHPFGDVPHVCIHETCPGDVQKEVAQSAVQRKARKLSAMAVDASGALQNEPVLRSQAEENMVNTLARIERLERVPGKPLHGKNWSSWLAMKGQSRECTPTLHAHKYKDGPKDSREKA